MDLRVAYATALMKAKKKELEVLLVQHSNVGMCASLAQIRGQKQLCFYAEWPNIYVEFA